MEKWRGWRVRRKNGSGRLACDGEYGEAEACRTENWNSGRNGEVAGGCLTQLSGEEGMWWPPEKQLAWTHQRSFTLGVREDWYGQVGSILRDEGWRRWRFSVWWFYFLLLPSIDFFFPIVVKRLHLQRSVGALRSSPPTALFASIWIPNAAASVPL